MAAIKALQQWCKNQSDGYRDVAVKNMTTSFRDGLAFCALIHKYRPDLINYDSLRKEDVYENNKLAFHVAEEHLGIPALLDAEDMVALSVPDRLSILTYVSQYYNYFNGRSPIGGVGGIKRPAGSSKEEPSEKKNLPVVAKTFSPKRATENCPPAPLNQKPPPLLKSEPAGEQKAVLVESSNKTGTLNSKCAVCKTHVHLVQRHLVDGKLYHRSCFKCSECSNPLLAGAYRTGPEPGTFICSAHQKGFKSSLPRAAQKNTPGRVNPPTPATPAVDVQAPKKDPRTQPDPRPSSVLTNPVKLTPRPVDPSPAPQPWTSSAQRTQAARQRFFQSSTPAPSPAPAPASSLSSAQAPRELLAPRPAPGPSKPEEKEHARALITRKLGEGNCNNNNTAYQFGIRAASNWSGKGLCSAGAPSWRLEKRSQGTAGGGAPPAHPPTPAPVISSSSTTTSNSNSKESLWLAAIRERERVRAPHPTSTPRPSPIVTTSTTTTTTSSSSSSSASAVLASSTKARRMACSEDSADWRSKLQPSTNGPSLKTPEPSRSLPLTPVENKPVTTYKASLCINVNSTTSPMVQPPTSPPSSGYTSYKSPSVQQPRRQSSGGSAVSSSSSASGAPSVKDPSPKPHQRGSAALGSQNEISRANGSLNGSSCRTPSVSGSVPPHRASSPKQARRGSAGPGSKKGDFISTGPTPHWITPVTVIVSPSKSTNHSALSPKDSPVEQGSTNGHYSSVETASVTQMRSPAKAHHIPMDEIVKELSEIEENLNELERDGVDLEKRLRGCEEEGKGDILIDPLMVDWFNLIHKKQGYMRRESELVYIAKTQDLEEQQPGVEGELRRLLDKPERLKSESERRQQAELMDRLLEIINDRNAIVEGLDQDRLREEEEDQQLNEMMQKLGVKKAKSKRQSSFSKLFRRKSKRVVAEG
ncbi:MICAL-like protein 2a isoform X2 [Clupea harengus]|uniref:MICAL-like protein 2a isoform X2 n=1 Tax=Clupea harengus TaxID=7950 RepID=A0A6P8F1R1_CLUHA|nr:MICAL-like protein 2a isoform X2 [Clupea harengus]